MCVSPIYTNGHQVACRNCKRCRDNRIKDWVGRCIAESRTATATFSITLTYGPDAHGNKKHARTAVLTYSDVQKYLKRLRNAGYKVRYLIAGEYGSLRGRAHWHGILFFHGAVPPHVLDKNFNDTDGFWEHGYQFWQKPTYHAVKYVCKYIQKDQGDEAAQGKFTMSKMPALGGHYFRRLAIEHVAKGVAPRGPFYRHPECKKQDGKPVEFYMRGTTADDYREAFVHEWLARRPDQHIPASEFVEQWLDEQVPEWRTSEKLEKLERAEKVWQELNETRERVAFREAYNLYFFGKNSRGLWDTEWRPEHEQEIEAFAEQGDEAEYISDLCGEIFSEEVAQPDVTRLGSETRALFERDSDTGRDAATGETDGGFHLYRKRYETLFRLGAGGNPSALKPIVHPIGSHGRDEAEPETK